MIKRLTAAMIVYRELEKANAPNAKRIAWMTFWKLRHQ